MHWNTEQRREQSFSFLGREVFPRRTAMLTIADQIARISEQQLNDGNAQVASLFSQFRFRLIVTVIATFGLGLLLAASSMTRILRLERESDRRYLEIEDARKTLKDLSARLVEAQENERTAISRELHDEVGQSLSALLVGLSNLSAAIPPSASGDLTEHVNGIRELAQNSVRVVRNMALLLRPSMLDDFGLVPALEWQAREVSRSASMRVNVAAEGIPESLPEEHKTCIYRIVQEALHNCARHSGANQVRITLKNSAGGIHVLIQDDGKGFRPEVERADRGVVRGYRSELQLHPVELGKPGSRCKLDPGHRSGCGTEASGENGDRTKAGRARGSCQLAVDQHEDLAAPESVQFE